VNNAFQKMKLDFRSSIPIYLQIVEQIQHLIATGVLKKGDQLPTVRNLATELRVNFNTVARAYRILDEERIISTQRGRGTYIWEEPDTATVEHLRQMSLEELISQAFKKIISLGYSPEEVADAMHKIKNTSTYQNESVQKYSEMRGENAR